MPAFVAAWNAAPDDNAKNAVTLNALQHGTSSVKIEALTHSDTRAQAQLLNLQNALNTATGVVNTANANAAAAQAIAAVATHQVFKPASPPKFKNKDNDVDNPPLDSDCGGLCSRLSRRSVFANSELVSGKEALFLLPVKV
jgi:hypothetical protein